MPEKFRTGFVSGNFFILHPGHIRFLRYASSLCEKLIVGVRDAQPNGRYPSPQERIEALKALNFKHEVVLLDSSLDQFLRVIKPDAVIKGNEYREVFNPEHQVVLEWGGEVVFSSGDANYHSTDLAHLDDHPFTPLQLTRPSAFIHRNQCSIDKIRDLVDKFVGLRVGVIGDLIVDEYVDCDPLGMSREDPTIVVSPVEKKRFLGGAGIVAAHACALGAQADYIGLVSNDSSGRFAKMSLRELGVRSKTYTDPGRPTTLKQRFRCDGKTLLRVSHLRQEDPSPGTQNKLVDAGNRLIANCDCIVLSDFNYGCLTQRVVDEITRHARQLKVTVSADSQSSSQTGDSSRFRQVGLLCATEHEARLALRAPSMGLSALGAELLRRSDAENLLLKLGPSGVVFLSRNDNPADLDRLNALNSNPVDVAGAGDSMLITATMALAVGATLAQAAYIGSIAAAIQVSRVGNIPITHQELVTALH